MALLTEEQVMLRDSARGWVQANAPVGAFRKMRDSESPLGFDAAMLQEHRRDGLDRRGHPREPTAARISATAASASCSKSSAAMSSRLR